jgi:demethylsterigmatocystin 6-O-methyltransferase
MTIQRDGTVSWLSAFPFKEELGGFQGKSVFVDIGGGFGHQCIALKQTFPELAGKLILEDQSQTLAQAPEIDGVEAIAHDFFKPQVVKGIPHIRTNQHESSILDLMAANASV